MVQPVKLEATVCFAGPSGKRRAARKRRTTKPGKVRMGVECEYRTRSGCLTSSLHRVTMPPRLQEFAETRSCILAPPPQRLFAVSANPDSSALPARRCLGDLDKKC